MKKALGGVEMPARFLFHVRGRSQVTSSGRLSLSLSLSLLQKQSAARTCMLMRARCFRNKYEGATATRVTNRTAFPSLVSQRVSFHVIGSATRALWRKHTAILYIFYHVHVHTYAQVSPRIQASSGFFSMMQARKCATRVILM